MPHDSIYVRFLKRQNYGNGLQFSGNHILKHGWQQGVRDYELKSNMGDPYGDACILWLDYKFNILVMTLYYSACEFTIISKLNNKNHSFIHTWL